MNIPESSPEPDFFQAAARHTQALLRTGRVVSRWIPKQEFVGNDGNLLAFRAIDIDVCKVGGCVRNIGMFSRDRGDDKDPWQRSRIVHHLTDGRGPKTYADHHAEKSTFMSMSTNPNFMVSFTDKRRRNPQEIAIINMHMLDILEVKYQSTADLHQEFRFDRQADGETWHRDNHYIAYDHIPQCCILGFIPADAFRDTWEEKKSRNPHAKTLNWYEDLRDHNQVRDQSINAIEPTYTPITPRLSPRRSDPAQPTTPTVNGRDITFSLRNTTLDTRGSGSRAKRQRSPSSDNNERERGGQSPSKKSGGQWSRTYPGPLDDHFRNAK